MASGYYSQALLRSSCGEVGTTGVMEVLVMVLGSGGCLMKAAAIWQGSCHIQKQLEDHIRDLKQRGRTRSLNKLCET